MEVFMEKNYTALKLIFSAAAASLFSYFGKLAVPVCVLIFTMLIDYASGMAKAYYKRELSSKIGFRGIIKKLCCLAMVAVGMAADYLISLGLADAKMPSGLSVGLLIAVWLIINELISILENLSAVGVPVPSFLTSLIERLKQSAEK